MVQCDDTTRVKQYRNDHLTSYDVEKKTLLSTNNSLKKQQERLLSQEIKKTCQEKLSEIPPEHLQGKSVAPDILTCTITTEQHLQFGKALQRN